MKKIKIGEPKLYCVTMDQLSQNLDRNRLLNSFSTISVFVPHGLFYFY